MMMSAALRREAPPPPAHPNDFDQKRIERTLRDRQRYRYVVPTVMAVAGGYRIEAPCCSRNIDASGGVIDIALMLHRPDEDRWQLYFKDHTTGTWQAHSTYPRLVELLTVLNADPTREFWQ